jgi:outer membrane scaffolding protein for murein synthesis (MipA/OmpV family)
MVERARSAGPCPSPALDGLRSWCRVLLAGVMLAGLAGPVRAGGNLLLIDAPPEQSSTSLGVSLWSLPKYTGSDQRDNFVTPALDHYRPSGLFVSTDNGLGWTLTTSKTLQAGVRLWPQLGRSRSDTPAGLEPIGWRIQAQGFANLQVGQVLLLQSGLLYGAGRDRDGVQLELGATSGIPIGDDLIGVGVSATWANASFRQSYFGVSAAESQASGLPAYTLGAGALDTNLTLSLEHKFGPAWRLSGQLIVSRLSGSTAQSPLTRQRRQTLGTLTLWRAF